jgi:hypothetical protein
LSVTGTDYLLVNNKRATVDQLAAAIGPDAALAEWNGANLNQFAAAVTSGFTNPALTVVTSGSVAYLNFTADAAAAGAYYIRYFSSPVTMQPMSGRIWTAIQTRQLGDEVYTGLAFAGSGTTPPLTNAVMIGVDNTDTTGGTFGAFNGANPLTYATWASGAVGQLSFDVTWSQVGANVPWYALTSTTKGVDAPGQFAGIPGLAGFPAVDAAWASSTPTKVGIIFYGGPNGAVNPLSVYAWDIAFEAR